MSDELFLTFDVDWVSDWILEPMIKALDEHKINATFFATHESSLLKDLEPARYEIGLHPNFDLGDGRYDLEALDRLKDIYPNAVGMRSHSLFFTSRVLQRLETLDIKYESNIFLFQHLGLQPTIRSKRVTSIPFNWSDDKHLELELSFDKSNLPPFNHSGVNVFNFHPVHFFLNTGKYEHYENAKSSFNKKGLVEYLNKGRGVQTLLKELLETISGVNIKTRLLRELV